MLKLPNVIFMGSKCGGEELPMRPPSPSQGNSTDGNLVKLRLDCSKVDFSGAELKKIMGNEKLAEIALVDPKRAKRCFPLSPFLDHICIGLWMNASLSVFPCS
ncbi:hypothetical protein VitviT2T_027828 [Vitis vinifera]|uniref:Uncharacterized protein n=1 Tax=Vitis vinifera TaxID=29760 RepID=A0ABY9DRU4_VITVI|nr:hypothetical protein VitviT2T_027828 [Vitis vinifera]